MCVCLWAGVGALSLSRLSPSPRGGLGDEGEDDGGAELHGGVGQLRLGVEQRLGSVAAQLDGLGLEVLEGGLRQGAAVVAEAGEEGQGPAHGDGERVGDGGEDGGLVGGAEAGAGGGGEGGEGERAVGEEDEDGEGEVEEAGDVAGGVGVGVGGAGEGGGEEHGDVLGAAGGGVQVRADGPPPAGNGSLRCARAVFMLPTTILGR